MDDLSAPIEEVSDGELIKNRSSQDILASLGFDSFDSVWNFQGGTVIKDILTRTVTRIDIQEGAETRTLFLKRHKGEFIGFQRVREAFWRGRAPAQGRREFENICEFRKRHIPAVEPVAAGRKVYRSFWADSFLITKDFSPYISLEYLFEKQPEFLKGPDGEARRKILLDEVARLARMMHQAGLNHRDFNATHILLHTDDASPTPKLALFDLQRVDRRTIFRHRWGPRTIARLNYTLPDELFDVESRLNLYLAYKNHDRLHLWDRLEWSWILKKTERIRRHTEKILERRKANAHAL